MSNPFIETATEALNENSSFTAAAAHSLARTALASLVQHRDDIARALWQHDVSQTPWEYVSDGERALYLSMADAVLAAITKES